MSTPNDAGDGDVSPGEAFAMLGNELRVDILRALAQVDEEAGDAERGRSFSSLYDQVEVSNTSTFAYHLGKLTGTFVRETDDGYRLTYAGLKVVRAIQAGTYNRRPEFESVELESLCPVCGETRFETSHEDDVLLLRCVECETPLVSYLLAPGQTADRTSMEVMESCSRYIRDEYSMAVDGVCAECLGKMEGRVERVDEPVEGSYLHVVECGQCGHRLTTPVELHLSYHPAVIAFYWDHGVDLPETTFWDLLRYLLSGEWETEVLATDPYEFRVTMHVDGDHLAVTFDEDLTVTRVEETTARTP